MAKVYRNNVYLTIKDNELKSYIAKGFKEVYNSKESVVKKEENTEISEEKTKRSKRTE